MKGRRFKFIWGASGVIRGRWYLGIIGFYERRPGMPDSAIAVSVRGLLAASLLLALAVYLAAASALFWIWQRNGFSEIRYTDALLYPMRRAEVSAAKGRAFLAQGKALFDAGKHLDAANRLRHGLVRHPHDPEARHKLAQFHVMSNQRPLALKVLADGLGPEFPGRPYLEMYFELAEQGEDHERIIATCVRYSGAGGGERDRRWLASRQFAALLADGRGDDALALADSHADGSETRQERVLALLALHRPADALRLLDEWEDKAGADTPVLLRLRARALREAGRAGEMERVIARLHALAPADPHALAYGVAEFALAGGQDASARALEDYLFRFGGSPANITLVAESLAEMGHRPLLLRCLEAATERGYPRGRLQMQVVQTHLQHGDWAAAAALLEQIVVPADRNARVVQAWREWAHRVVRAALAAGDSPQLPLIELLRSRPWPLLVLRQSVEAMLLAGRLDTAREITAVGMRSYPESRWLKNTAETLRQQLAAREASLPLPAGRGEPVDDETFFRELQRLSGAGRWDEVERAIREVRAARPPPDWLARRDSELWFAQIRSGQARGDRSALIAAARMHLLGGANRAPGLLELGCEFKATGDQESAIVIAKEILRRFPDDSPTKRLLAEWMPAPDGREAPAKN